MAKKETKKGPDLTKLDIEGVISQINKDIGDNTILCGPGSIGKVEVISSGALTLDIALGVGGLPKGRIVEIYGPESSGKTTLMLTVIREAQKNGGIAAFVDCEHAIDPTYAESIGVDMDKLLISQPASGEDALRIIEMLCLSGKVSIVALDSVAALVPKEVLDGQIGDRHMAPVARLMSQALGKLAPIAHKTNTLVVFSNQIRTKVGLIFGNPETQPGGRALKFYASVRLEIKRTGKITDSSQDDTTGCKTKVTVVKNKVAPPFRIAEFDIKFAKGIDDAGCILDLAALNDTIRKAGSHYTLGDTKFNGREAAIRGLLDNPELMADLREQIMRLKMPYLFEEPEEPEVEDSNIV